jgi:hypothetical protein
MRQIPPYVLTINPLKFISSLIGNQFFTTKVLTTLEQMRFEPTLIWELTQEAEDRFDESFLNFEPSVFNLIWDSLTIENYLANTNFHTKINAKKENEIYQSVITALNNRFDVVPKDELLNDEDSLSIDLIEIGEFIHQVGLTDKKIESLIVEFWKIVQETIFTELEELIRNTQTPV